MNPLQPLPLLGGLTPRQFMKRHWQKKPLLIRHALPMGVALQREELFALASRDDVSSRLVRRSAAGWTLRKGPLRRRALPALRQPDWTLLVQGVDLHADAAHDLLQRFRFIPDARLDDVMVSYASNGGGVGPHVDSYDVFLLQVHGQRRWRIGPLRDRALLPGLPLRILANFEPTQEHLLQAGDMLYLPPGFAHDGVAVGECMTCSIGFRAPGRMELGRELLQRVPELACDAGPDSLFGDPGQDATRRPAQVPQSLQTFARGSVRHVLRDPRALPRALGEYLSEPVSSVWFSAQVRPKAASRLALDPKSRMLYDRHHVFLNGESFHALGHDALLLRRLADRRELPTAELAGAGAATRELLDDWIKAGWMHER